MKENYFITTSEYQESASTLAQQWNGVVLVLGTAMLGENSTNSMNSGNNISEQTATTTPESANIWTLEIKEWHTDDENNTLTYSDAGIENGLMQTKITFIFDFLPIGVYAVVLPASIASQQKEVVLSYIADVLRKYDNFVEVVTSDSFVTGSKTADGGNL